MKNIHDFTDFELISELYRRFCQNPVNITLTTLVQTPSNVIDCPQDPALQNELNSVFKRLMVDRDLMEWPEPD